MKNQPSAKSCKYRFQTHNQRCSGGLQIFLSNNLQAVSDAHGENTGKAQRQPAGEDVTHVQLFGQQHEGNRKHCHYQSLNTVQSETIQILSESVDQQDLNSEAQSTADEEQVTNID